MENNSLDNKMSDLKYCISGGVVTSELQQQVYHIQWRIENFKLVIQDDHFTRKSSFEFRNCCSSDPYGFWKLSLQSQKDAKEKWLGVVIGLPKSDRKEPAKHNTRFYFTIRKSQGDPIEADSLGAKLEANNDRYSVSADWILSKLIQTEPVPTNVLLEDGALKIEIKAVVTSSIETGDNLYPRFASQMAVLKLLQDIPPPTENATFEPSSGDLVLTPKEGMEGKALIVSKTIVSARSTSFAAILAENPAMERLTIEVSSKTLSTFVHYLYTGALPSGSLTTYKDITELALAALTYTLPDLHEHCDQILAEKCTIASSGKMLQLAQEVGLDKSAKEITEFVRRHAFKIAQYVETPNCLESRMELLESSGSLNYNSEAIAVTGIQKERTSFTWNIVNFHDIWKSLKSQKTELRFQKKLGYSKNPSAVWEFYLTSTEDEDVIQVAYSLDSKPHFLEVYSYLFVTIPTRGEGPGSYCFEETDCESLWTLGSKRASCSIQINEDLPLHNGSLRIEFELTVITPKWDGVDGRQCQLHSGFEEQGRLQLLRDFEALYKLESVPSDVKLVSMEGTECPAHWKILTARCEVFKTMFGNQMEEKKSGIVKIDDISSPTLKTLLHYVYTGGFEPEGFLTADDIINVAYAAEKYNLPELKDYCDHILPDKCDVGSALQALEASRKLRLKRTEKVMVEYILKNPEMSLDGISSLLADL